MCSFLTTGTNSPTVKSLRRVSPLETSTCSMVSHTESCRISISHQTSPGLGPLESRTDLSKQIIYEVPANDAAARLCHTESTNQCNINVQQTGAGFGLGGCDDITRRDSKSDRLQVKQTFLAQPRI